jgi:hypothetical protein
MGHSEKLQRGGLHNVWRCNAAAASIKGIDVDVKAIPVANLTLTASFEYLNARYDQDVNGTLATYSPGCAPI